MKKFKSLAEHLDQIVQHYNLEMFIVEGDIINNWKDIVGPRIASNTEVQRIKDGILVVKVKNDVWRNELTFHKADLLEKINRFLSKKFINDIRWI